MLKLVAIVFDGLSYASWLFMVSVGLTLIYGVMKILNIAHGSLFALGAYAAASLVGVYFASGLPPVGSYVVLPVAAVIVGAFFGLLIERGILRFMYGRDEVLMVLVTYAVFLVLEDVMKLVWGVDPYFTAQPYGLLGTIDVFGLPYAVYDFALILIALLLGVGVWWGLNRTGRGKLLVAVIHDREMSRAMGINVTAMFLATFMIGSMLGALGGALTAPKISVVPGIGVEVIREADANRLAARESKPQALAAFRDDTDPLVNPGAVDACNDGLDADCDTLDSCGSCEEWLVSDATLATGVYPIRPLVDEFEVYCDMETDGGGWTMVASTSASSRAYSASHTGCIRSSS